VERDDGFPGLGGGEEREKSKGPGVAERGSVEGGSGGRPDWCQAVDENGPEGWKRHDGDGGGLGCGVRKKIV
jgi:hypothetical protein